MGPVYLAQDFEATAPRCCQNLAQRPARNLEFSKRLNQEADMTASVYHEYIVGIHDHGNYQEQL